MRYPQIVIFGTLILGFCGGALWGRRSNSKSESRTEISSPSIPMPVGQNANPTKTEPEKPKGDQQAPPHPADPPFGNPFSTEVQLNICRLGMMTSMDDMYGAYFRSLHFSPERYRQLRFILAERLTLPMVVETAVRQNAGGDPAFAEEFLNEEKWKRDEALRQLLTKEEYDKFVEYDKHTSIYARVDKIRNRLDYLKAPITPEQQELIVSTIKSLSPEPIAAPPLSAASDTWATYISKKNFEKNALVARMEKSLSAEQAKALQEYLDEEVAPVAAMAKSITGP